MSLVGLTDNKQIELIPRHGKTVRVWKGENVPPNFGEFKIKAVADTFFGLKVGNEQ